MRLALLAAGSSAAPYASPILRSVSQSSGKSYWNFFAKARFASCVSKLMPRIWASFFSNSSLRSRNPEPSLVQPGVSAFG
jgi:hypothetical protein